MGERAQKVGEIALYVGGFVLAFALASAFAEVALCFGIALVIGGLLGVPVVYVLSGTAYVAAPLVVAAAGGFIAFMAGMLGDEE